MAKINPFRPGQIVSPGMFHGRVNELDSLERALEQTKAGNPRHFLLQGERGIGKSSLLYYVDLLATGQVTCFDNHSRFKFVVLNIELDPGNDYLDIIKKIGTELTRAIERNDELRRLAKQVWDFLSKWEVLGVKFRREQATYEQHTLLADLAESFINLDLQLAKTIDGLLILVDEADKPPASANLGQFSKLLTERLTKRGCNRVSLGLAGLPAVTTKLRRSHESSLRIFETMTLSPLEPQERQQVVLSGLKQVKNSQGLEIGNYRRRANGDIKPLGGFSALYTGVQLLGF